MGGIQTQHPRRAVLPLETLNLSMLLFLIGMGITGEMTHVLGP